MEKEMSKLSAHLIGGPFFLLRSGPFASIVRAFIMKSNPPDNSNNDNVFEFIRAPLEHWLSFDFSFIFNFNSLINLFSQIENYLIS